LLVIKHKKASGESSEYLYNALGVRIENVQVRTNKNAGNQNANLKDGSHGTDYLRFLKDGRSSWQRVWETEIGTTVQNDKETVTRHHVVDYLSIANRDIFVTEDGSYTSRYVYDASGRRLSAEFDYAEGTKRGEEGENLQSDIAVEIGKVFYRTSILGSTLFAVDKAGNLIAHAIYDPWGKPLKETYTDANYSGLENLNNYTGYTYDLTLALYFAQNRFYDADTHRFTQEDWAKSGVNWYVYCYNSPIIWTDFLGLYSDVTLYVNGKELNGVAILEKGKTYIRKSALSAFFLRTGIYPISSYLPENNYLLVGDQKLYFETINDECVIGLRKLTDATGYSDTLSWWYESGNIVVTINPAMKGAPVQVIRKGNQITITAYVEFIGDWNQEADFLGRKFSYAQLAVMGIKNNWSGYYEGSEYDLFGDYEKVHVNVNINAEYIENGELGFGTSRRGQRYLPIYICTSKDDGEEHRAHTEGNASYEKWNVRNKNNKMFLHNHIYCSTDEGVVDYYYSSSNFMQVAAHEFGHILGLGDAYKTEHQSEAADTYEIPFNEPWKGDMMRNDGYVTPNDIEMMLEAWKMNAWQAFVSDDPSRFGTSPVIHLEKSK